MLSYALVFELLNIQFTATQTKAWFKKLLPQRQDPIEPAVLNITFKMELMPDFYLPNDYEYNKNKSIFLILILKANRRIKIFLAKKK